LACRSSRFSRSSAFKRSANSVGTPARLPLFTSAFFTHSSSVCPESITNAGGVSATNLITIRGIAGQPLPIGASQATAVYLDGVYIARPDGAIFGLDDVDRIEVLRGPQGTLYGRNATAGAINIITRTPGDRLRAGGSIRYGNFESVSAKGSLSGPLGAGISAGVSGSYSSRDGYFVNSLDNRSVRGTESYTLRGTLRYASPDDSFSMRLSADTSRVDNPSFLKSIPATTPGPVIGNPNIIATEIPQLVKQEIEQSGVSLTLDYQVGEGIDLTSITSYRDLRTATVLDADGTTSPVVVVAVNNQSKSFMQELRALLDRSGWRLTFGGNYFHEDATLARAANPVDLAVLRDPYDISKLDAFAAFAQGELDITEQLTLVAGLRFNHENRRFSLDYTARNAAFFYPGSLRDSALIPSAGINFKPSSDLLLYVKASKGYQAPGFEYSPGPTAGVRTFAAEDLWAYEAGAKAQLFDRRLTIDLAAFYYDYKDIQVRSNVSFGVTAVENAASAKIKGIEIGVTARPVSFLTFGANLAYLDARYGVFCQPISGGTPQGSDPLCAAGIANRFGNRLNQAPEWSGNMFASIELPAGDAGKVKANANFAWESNVYYSTSNIASVSSGGWHSLDARFGFEIANGPELFVFGKNLTNDRYISWSAQATATILAGSVNAPRTYGVGVEYHF
jgi:iron complex outermembrane receptor protein